MKMKRILSIILAVTMLASVGSVASVYADENTGTCGPNATFTWDEATKTLTFEGSGEITSNENFKQYYDRIENVIMDKSEITSICDCAFGPYDPNVPSKEAVCPNLKKVTFPSTLKSIGDTAFYRTALTEIDLPEGLETIGNGAFTQTPLTGELVLPSTLKTIRQAAFYGTDITSVTLHEGMILNGTVFRECESLTEVTIPKGLTYYKNGEGNTSGPNKLFYKCINIETVIVEEEAQIAEGMFKGCTGLKDVYIYSRSADILGPLNNSYNAMFDTDPIFHIYKGSITEMNLRIAGYLTEATEESDANYVYMTDFKALDDALAVSKLIDVSLYTDETASALTEAIEAGTAVRNNPDASQEEVDQAVKTIEEAISSLKEKPTESDKTDPDSTTKPTTATTASKTTAKATANDGKNTAEKAIKQAKITKLTAKSKSKKKITVTWKKVKKAVGYQVQVSAKKNFKKIIFKKFTSKKKLTICKKIKSGKTYFVRVRAYATYKDKNGKAQKVYSKWNKKLRKVKVK